MASCCCSLAGTAACQNCANNPYATADDGVMAVVNHLRTYVEPQTNADRIRAMSDEELAEWMATKTSCMRCPVDLDACHNFEFSGEMSCEEILLSWLKSPMEKAT